MFGDQFVLLVCVWGILNEFQRLKPNLKSYRVIAGVGVGRGRYASVGVGAHRQGHRQGSTCVGKGLRRSLVHIDNSLGRFLVGHVGSDPRYFFYNMNFEISFFSPFWSSKAQIKVIFGVISSILKGYKFLTFIVVISNDSSFISSNYRS